MIGKIIGAGLGAKVAKQSSAIGGPLGAVLGAAAPFVLRKASIPAMIVLGAGGYAVKKYMDRRSANENTPGKPKVAPSAT